MHDFSVGVVGIEVVDAFTDRNCLPAFANVDLGVSFHDLCDSPSQVLQQSNEVIDFILFHQSNALACIELSRAIHEDLLQSPLGESLVGADASDALCPPLTEEPKVTLTMITLHCHLQEERISHLWCCDVMHGINIECLQWGVSEVFKCISHESHIEYVVQLVVLSPCLDIKGLLQLHHVIIFILWHHFTLHIINALLARRNDCIAQ